MQYAQHKRTQAGAGEALVGCNTGAWLQRDPSVAEQANRGGLGLRKMIEPSDEGGKLQTTSRMKRKRKMREKRRTSRRPWLLFSI